MKVLKTREMLYFYINWAQSESVHRSKKQFNKLLKIVKGMFILNTTYVGG